MVNKGLTDILTKREAAAMLCVTTRTIDSWRARGIDMGVVYTPTRRVRFSAEAIEKMLRTRRPRPPRDERNGIAGGYS